MRIKWLKKIFYVVVFLLAFNLTAEGGQEIITLHYPPDKTIMEFGLMGISLSIPQGSAELINIRVNNRKEVSRVLTRKFECFSVLLALGINKINITAVKKDSIVGEVNLSVFRRSDLISAYKDPPTDFQKDYFHMKDRSQCAACHILEPKESDKKPINIATFSTEAAEYKAVVASTSTCYSCHKKITSYYPFVHGPSSVWSCLSCHEYQTVPRYAVKKPDTEVCFSCHEEEKKEWYNKKYFHGPFNTGKCAICHNPHASDNPFNLVEPTWILCISCHADRATGRHIVEGYVDADNHPTHGVPDPIRKGRELTCASCHESHASDSSRLWRLNVETGIALCKECHIGKM